MQSEFKMSIMDELHYFLGLLINQTNEIIFINQSKYYKELLLRFGMQNSKEISTFVSTCFLDKDEGSK